MDHDDPVRPEWRNIANDYGANPDVKIEVGCLDRIRVPGGWLYRQVFYGDNYAVALAFVPKAWPPE